MIRRLTILLLIVGWVYATVINVPTDSTTIQAGINGAEDGDTVLVAAGTYYENIIWAETNGIKLIGSGEGDCVIDGNDLESVIGIFSNELGGVTINKTTLIKGFTIQNGSNSQPYQGGGGMKLFKSSPTLQDVVFSDNHSVWYGGGMYLSWSSPTLTNVTFSGNVAGLGGGMGLKEYSYPTLTSVTFSDNTAIHGGGLCLWESSNPTLTNVTFSDNTASEGGGLCLWESSNPTLTNSILWGNSPQEIYFRESDFPSSITITYSDIQGGETGIITNDDGTVYWQEGNIDVNPLFTDTEDGDYTLQTGSPCIDVCPSNIETAEPFDDLNSNGIWDENEPFLDLNQNGIYDTSFTIEILPEDAYCGSTLDMGAYEYCAGCTDDSACNFDDTATDDDLCEYAEENFDCDGNCIVVVDECGVCGGSNECLSCDKLFIPEYYSISNIHPNPFNPVASITYGLLENGNVALNIYNIQGRLIETLMNNFQTAGYHTIGWDASSHPSGVYLIRMDSGEFTQTQKVVLVK